MLLACCMGLDVQAQTQTEPTETPFHLDGGFNVWEECYPIDGYEKPGTTKVGEQPVGWKASNVKQSVATKALVTKQTEESNVYASIKNDFVGFGPLGANAPGYLTLGQPWAYALLEGIGSIKEADGGTYGGISFTHLPDAVSFLYKSSHAEENPTENFTAVAYLWKGTFKSMEKIGVAGGILGGSIEAVEVADRDRAVLGMKETTAQGTLVASVVDNFNNDAAEWTEKVIEFDYKSDELPEKLNIIISSADYFGDRNKIGAGNTLNVDSVRLLYYSELATLTYDGQEVPVAAEMDLSTVEYDESKLSCTLTGRGATLEKAYDESTGVLTLTVKGNDWTEENRNEHVYTVQFAVPVPVPASEVEGTYNRQVTVEMAGSVISQTMNDILITSAGDGSYTLQLNDFFFSGQNLGSIVVPGVTAAYAEDGSISLTAPEQSITIDGPGAGLGELPVTLDMALADGKLTGRIGIVWNNMPIQVTVGDRTVQAADVEGTYSRWLTVAINGDAASESANDIIVGADDEGTYTLQLNNFAFGDLSVGDIVVPGTQAAYAEDGSIDLTATANVTIDLFPTMPLPTTVNLNLATTDDGDKVMTGEIDIDFSLMGMAINVAVGDVPFQTEADGRTLKVTGTVSALAAPSVVPADGSFLAIDLTEATTGEGLSTENFTNTQPNTLFYVAADTQLAGSNVVAGGACADLVITDAEDFYVPADFTATELAYNRTLTAGQYAAVVLPFGVDASQLDGTAYTLDGVDGDVLQFVTAEGTIDAHVPFLFRPSDTQLFADDTELTVVPVYATPDEVPVVAYDNVRFTGTYTSLALASSADESWYSCVNDEFVPVAADAVLLPFSAALQTDGTYESYRLSFDGKVVGICGPTLTTEGAPADVYTIGGQFVRRAADATQALEGLPAGIYIVGGKKVVK